MSLRELLKKVEEIDIRIGEEDGNIPEVFNMHIYDDLFPPQIKKRGESYFNNNQVLDFKELADGSYDAVIKGSDLYHVTLKLDGDQIKEATCTCPYYEDDKKLCKHIYALLYKVKASDNKEILRAKVIELLKEIKELEAGKKYLPKEYRFNYSNATNLISSRINDADITEETLINFIKRLTQIENHFCDLVYNHCEYDELEIIKEAKEAENTDNNEYDYLEDWQQELVKSGEYEPWNFEEEDLEEDDYYYDDEDMNEDE